MWLLKILAFAFAGLLVFVVAWLGLVGRDETWRLMAGPADLGAVDFSTLERRTTPNDALECPVDYCLEATSDFPPQTFNLPASRLADIFDQAMANELDLQRVDDMSDPLYRRYVQRSRLLRFPDTIDVRFIAGSEGNAQSAGEDADASVAQIAIYSRSQLGTSDLGVNRQRIERWLGALRSAIAGNG